MTPRKKVRRTRSPSKGLRSGDRSWLTTRGGVFGLAGLVLVAAGFFVLLNMRVAGGPSQGQAVGTNKSMGSPEAPVTVVEYGDFQ